MRQWRSSFASSSHLWLRREDAITTLWPTVISFLMLPWKRNEYYQILMSVQFNQLLASLKKQKKYKRGRVDEGCRLLMVPLWSCSSTYHPFRLHQLLYHQTTQHEMQTREWQRESNALHMGNLIHWVIWILNVFWCSIISTQRRILKEIEMWSVATCKHHWGTIYISEQRT